MHEKPPNKALQTDKDKLSCLLHPQKPRQLALAAELGCLTYMIARIAMTALGLSVASHLSAEECRLSGVWRSDAARTLAAIAEVSDPKALNTLSNGLFGHMIHEWTCTEMRAWFEDNERGKPTAYTIVQSDEDSVVVSFPDGSEQNLRLTFEGECYKIPFGNQRYEYFCPIERRQ